MKDVDLRMCKYYYGQNHFTERTIENKPFQFLPISRTKSQTARKIVELSGPTVICTSQIKRKNRSVNSIKEQRVMQAKEWHDCLRSLCKRQQARQETPVRAKVLVP